MIITFLSDYGPGDEYVGVVHGVIAQIAPDARIIDLGHGVPAQDVRTGARRLAPGNGLWFDELFTAEVGRLPLGDIVSAIASGEGTTR